MEARFNVYSASGTELLGTITWEVEAPRVGVPIIAPTELYRHCKAQAKAKGSSISFFRFEYLAPPLPAKDAPRAEPVSKPVSVVKRGVSKPKRGVPRVTAPIVHIDVPMRPLAPWEVAKGYKEPTLWGKYVLWYKDGQGRPTEHAMCTAWSNSCIAIARDAFIEAGLLTDIEYNRGIMRVDDERTYSRHRANYHLRYELKWKNV